MKPEIKKEKDAKGEVEDKFNKKLRNKKLQLCRRIMKISQSSTLA